MRKFHNESVLFGFTELCKSLPMDYILWTLINYEQTAQITKVTCLHSSHLSLLRIVIFFL